MDATCQEDAEALLASSRAKIVSLWLKLKMGEIGRGELNAQMSDMLDELEVGHREVYLLLQPELHALRQGVIGDADLRNIDR